MERLEVGFRAMEELLWDIKDSQESLMKDVTELKCVPGGGLCHEDLQVDVDVGGEHGQDALLSRTTSESRKDDPGNSPWRLNVQTATQDSFQPMEAMSSERAIQHMKSRTKSIQSMMPPAREVSYTRVSTMNNFSNNVQHELSTMARFVESSDALAKTNSQDSEGMASRTAFVAATLPLSWPSVLGLRHSKEIGRAGNRSTLVDRTQLSSTSFVQRMTSAEDSSFRSDSEDSFEVPSAWMRFLERWVVLNPNSPQRMIWDLLSLMVLVHDLTFIPYALAWDLTYTNSMSTLAWLTVGFWTMDILLSFVTGFVLKGELFMRPKHIARHYFATWFVPDFCIVLCDWLSLIIIATLESAGGSSHSSSSSLKILRFAKLGRLLRILGMLRVVRFVLVIEDFLDRNLSESQRVGLRILSMFAGIVWANHLMCCIWYAIGRLAPSDTRDGGRWIEDSLVAFDEQPVFYQYVTSFHWSISQITLGSIEIDCQNSAERIFNILCLMVGLLFGSTLVSSLSATMVEYQMMKKERVQKLRMLRQFLRDNQVDLRVSRQVQNQIRERLGEKEKLTDKDVPVLSLLSSSLRAELRLEIFTPYIERHPLIRLWTHIDPGMVRKICMNSVDFIFYRPQDDVFVPGPALDQMYYVVKGTLQYIQSPESAPVEEQVVSLVDKGWLCEAALWTEWIHVGTATCLTQCQLVEVRATAVGEVLQMRHIISDITSQYCKEFHKRVITAMPPSTVYPDDTQVPFADYPDIVYSMDQELQVAIGRFALESEKMNHWSRGKAGAGIQKLKNEVERGKSIVMMSGKGDVERVVQVIALRIEDHQSRLFVQVAKREDEKLVPTCQFPGAKQERGEMISDAVQRILKSKLGPLAGLIEVLSTERSIETKESKEHGVRTRYLRTVCHTRLRDSMPVSSSISCALPIHTYSQRSNDKMDQIFVIKDALYAWLTSEEFELLKEESDEAELVAFLESIEPEFQAIKEAESLAKRAPEADTVETGDDAVPRTDSGCREEADRVIYSSEPTELCDTTVLARSI